MLLCANILTVVGLLATGYSACINPAHHPYASLIGFAFPAFLLANVAFIMFWVLFNWRYVIVPIAGMLLAYQPVRTYFPINKSVDEHEIPDGCLKVLSYNILGYNPVEAPKDEPNPILQYLVDSDADIICLQEYGHPRGQDSLFAILDSKYQYCDTIHSHGINRGSDMVGIYSKYPIIHKEHIKAYTIANAFGVFDLDIDGDTVHFVNLHLETVGMSEEQKTKFSDIVHGRQEKEEMKSDSKMIIRKLARSAALRAPQADAVNEYLRRHKGERIILCGDLNDHPLSYVHHTIADRLTDCYPAVGQWAGFTFQYRSMYVRLDNIMCSAHYEPVLCKVDKSVKLSDHFPVYCFLRQKNREE